MPPIVAASPGPCDSNPCQNGGTCTEIMGENRFECICNDTFTGNTCEKRKRKYQSISLATPGAGIHFWIGMCRWGSESLTLYQTIVNLCSESRKRYFSGPIIQKISGGACPWTPYQRSPSALDCQSCRQYHIRNPSMQKCWLRPCLIQHIKQYHIKVLLSSCHLNSHTLGFPSQTFNS